MTDAAFWNELAEEYAAKPVELPNAFERKIEITQSLMLPSDVVLDIGCGTGSLALRLAPSGGEVHGLDVSKEMIRIARKKAEYVANVTFHTGAFDASFDAIPDGSLDGICAYSFLHLIEDRSAALHHIHRLLKPGGFFVTSTLCLGDSWIPYVPILAVMRWIGKAPLVKVFSKSTFETELTDTGFIDIAQPNVGAKAQTAFMVSSKPR